MKTFIGEQTKSPVRLNTSENFVILENPTAEYLLGTVEKILTREIRELWDEQFQESQKLDEASDSKTFLCAFELYADGKSKFCADDIRVLARCAKIEYKSTSQVINQLCNLPIERQIRVLHSLDEIHRDVLVRSRLRTVNWRISTSEILSEQISRGCSLQDLLTQLESGVDDWKLPIAVGEDRRDHVIMIAARIVAHCCAVGYVFAPASRLVVSGQVTSKLTETYVEEFLASLLSQRKLLTDELLRDSLLAYGHETARKARVHIANFVACNDATQIGDFSSELLSTFADCYVRKAVGPNRSNSLKEIRRVTKVVIRLCIKKYPLWPISHASPGVIKEPRQRGKQFVWAKKHEYLTDWIALASKYVDSIPGQVTHVIASINDFLEFIVKRSSKGLDTPRTIWDLRPEHFLAQEEPQELTLFDYVEALKSKKPGLDAKADLGAAGRTRRCKCIHNFLNWIVKKTPGSSNPMSMDDFRFTGKLNKGRTSRIALDDSIIGALKHSIVRFERDKTGKITNIEFPLSEAAGDIVEAFDKTEGRWVKVVWPGRAVLLYLLLCVPIRTFQARWCDSGVNDVKIYDIDSGSFIRNPDAISAITSGQDGILREITDEATAVKLRCPRVS